MKLRVYENQIRLRLSRREVERVAERESIESSAALLPQPLIVRLVPHDRSFSTRFIDGTLTIFAAADTMCAWSEGDEVSVSNIDALGVHVLIEKDFQCLHGDGEDQPDCFPNPLADASA